MTVTTSRDAKRCPSPKDNEGMFNPYGNGQPSIDPMRTALQLFDNNTKTGIHQLHETLRELEGQREGAEASADRGEALALPFPGT